MVLSAHCVDYPHLGLSTDVIGVLLVVGTQISYLPQIIELVRKRSSFGVSVLSRLTFQLMITCQVTAIFAVQWRRVQCCATWGVSKCWVALLEQGQLYLIFLNIAVLFLLVLAFFEPTQPGDPGRREYLRAWQMATVAFVFAIMAFGALALVLVVATDPAYAEAFSIAMGVGAGVFQVLANLPQILTTYRLKRVGSVSIVTNAIQGLGGILQFYFMLRNSVAQVQVWLPVFFNAALQTFLAVELAYYWVAERRRSKLNNHHVQSVSNHIYKKL